MNNYISKLECKNIGVFESLTINFSARCNVLIGSNGAGKTTILKLICMALVQHHLNKIRFRKGATLILSVLEGNDRVLYGATNIASKDQPINTFDWQGGPKTLDPKMADKLIVFGHNTSTYKLLAIGAHRYFNYHKIEGMKGEEKGKTRLQRYLTENVNYLDSASLPDIKQWMINRYFIVEKDWASIERENWNYVIEYLPKLSPDKTVIRFVKIEHDLEPVFDINGRECYLEELSSGFKSILGIVLSIVDWIEGINEGEAAMIKSAHGTVLIDEIDVHLHPQWQQVILHLLKSLFKSIQFIVTAHSPLVVMSAEENEIIVIPDHNGEVNLAPQARAFRAWSSEHIMSNLMGFQSNGTEDETINDILDRLDKAIVKGDLDGFSENLEDLKHLVSPEDPLVAHYEIKKSVLYINRKK